jgi:hypothetical protein
MFDHLIIKNLPNEDAHKTLYKSFMNKVEEYDLLIKVDADMVLCSRTLFEDIVDRFESDPVLAWLSIAVYDFFSGQLINGLNSYRNTLKWSFNDNTLFVDMPDNFEGTHIHDKTELAPAAIHCKNPSNFQAFHYGVHRGLKSLRSKTHWHLLNCTWKNYLEKGDPRIGLAVLGAELVYSGTLSAENVNYDNEKLREVFLNFNKLNSNQLKKEIRKFRLRNWGFLPNSLRRKKIINSQNLS